MNINNMIKSIGLNGRLLGWGLRRRLGGRLARPCPRCGAVCALGGRAFFIRRAGSGLVVAARLLLLEWGAQDSLGALPARAVTSRAPEEPI